MVGLALGYINTRVGTWMMNKNHVWYHGIDFHDSHVILFVSVF